MAKTKKSQSRSTKSRGSKSTATMASTTVCSTERGTLQTYQADLDKLTATIKAKHQALAAALTAKNYALANSLAAELTSLHAKWDKARALEMAAFLAYRTCMEGAVG